MRGTLAQVAADACHLVAYQAFDQGRRVQAIEGYRCSAELAAQGRAQDLYVFAMCGVAYMHARNHDGDLALSLLHQLAPLARSPAAQCYVAVYRAHALAGLRDHSDAFPALDEAAALSSQAHNDAPSPWLGVPDAMFVQRQRAMIATALGSSEAWQVRSAEKAARIQAVQGMLRLGSDSAGSLNPAAPWHSAGPPPDSNSSQPAAPAPPPTSTRTAPPATANRFWPTPRLPLAQGLAERGRNRTGFESVQYKVLDWA